MSIITGFLILAILVFIVEVLSIALKLTGLNIEKARFQVISIITNTGFTTKESELIAQHQTRRSIAQMLMLISYVGYATIIGLVVNILQSDNKLLYMAITVIIILTVILVFIRNKWLVRRLESLIEKQLRTKMKKMRKYRTVEEVLNLNEEYGVAEFVIEEGNRLIGMSLGEAKLTRIDIQVLNIDRGSYIIHFPKGSSVFMQGDRVTVYGKLVNIKELVVNQYKLDKAAAN
ncbi:TrkA C-terminal domain-containing protein [Brassicibacter mesophilus]|uniref:TrkA C-terminal domain-containing protein n=1 Tax=Brassicibacter mesophilus TaxID=745119 RepID=UPI003D23BE08